MSQVIQFKCGRTPILEALLRDKLTTYGPNTTGIPLSKPMDSAFFFDSGLY